MIFLDTSTVIYLLEGKPEVQQSVRQHLASLRATGGESPLATSVLTCLECRVKPLREKDHDLLERYDRFFDHPGLMLVKINTAVINGATELRAYHGLKTPDAIQAACAMELADDATFVTGDSDFKAVPGLRMIQVIP